MKGNLGEVKNDLARFKKNGYILDIGRRMGWLTEPEAPW
jgi:hypothetical protein